MILCRSRAQLNADRQPLRVHGQRQGDRRCAENVMRQRELADGPENRFCEILHRHIGPPEIVVAPGLRNSRRCRRQPDIVPGEVAAELPA